jgi:hypothetical protein
VLGFPFAGATDDYSGFSVASAGDTLILSDATVRRLPESRADRSGKKLSIFGGAGDVLHFDTTQYRLEGQFSGSDRYVRIGGTYRIEISREILIEP